MKDALVLGLIILVIFIVSMGVVTAIFERDYWRAVTSLTALVLLGLAAYPRLTKLDKRKK